MEKIRVIVNGLPGKMATEIAEAVINSKDMELLPHSLTGPEVDYKMIMIHLGFSVTLYQPDEKDQLLSGGIPDIIVDFTHPSAIEENVTFYTDNKIPFVLGTTGGDLTFIKDRVTVTAKNAVVAPNMAKEIVVFQAMMEFAAEKFPGAFEGFTLEVAESHQKTKADTSGTAKAVVTSFNGLGIPFTFDQIIKKRSEEDYKVLGVPSEFWDGHGWHTYTIKKPDGNVFLQFTHNVNGRKPYIDGVLEAVRYLYMVETCLISFGMVHSMTDVLDGNLKEYQRMMAEK